MAMVSDPGLLLSATQHHIEQSRVHSTYTQGGRSSRSAWHLEGLAGAMASFEDAFASPQLNRWLGGFLGAGAAGLQLQCMAFRASKSLAGGSDRMRLHCLRCLWRWERWGSHPDMMVLARRDGPPGRPFVRALMADDHLSVDVASPGDLVTIIIRCHLDSSPVPCSEGGAGSAAGHHAHSDLRQARCTGS